MTDTTTRDIDVPPAGSLWCECGEHAARPEKSLKCPLCDPTSYANYRMEPFVAPKFDNGGNLPPAMTYPTTAADWTPPEEDECSPSARLPISTQTCDTTSTDDSEDSTGPASASPNRLIPLWMRALRNPGHRDQ